jgi:hypothetical protein
VAWFFKGWQLGFQTLTPHQPPLWATASRRAPLFPNCSRLGPGKTVQVSGPRRPRTAPLPRPGRAERVVAAAPRAAQAGRRAGRACCRSGPVVAPGQPPRQASALQRQQPRRASRVLPGRAREPPATRAPEAGRACCRGAPGSRRAARTRGRASPFREDGEAVSASAHGRRHRQTVSLSPTMTPARVAVERGGAPPDVPPCCRSGSRASTVRPFRMGRRRESG